MFFACVGSGAVEGTGVNSGTSGPLSGTVAGTLRNEVQGPCKIMVLATGTVRDRNTDRYRDRAK